MTNAPAARLPLLLLLAVPSSAFELNAPNALQQLQTAPRGQNYAGQHVTRRAYIVSDGVDIFKEPRDGSPDLRLTQLRQGETVTVLSQSRVNGWYQVTVNQQSWGENGWGPLTGWVRQNSVGDSAPMESKVPQFQQMDAGPCRQAFADKLKSFQGVKYEWGGTSRSSVDCSGLVVAALQEAACVSQSSPRTADDQKRMANEVADPNALKIGDMIYRMEGDATKHVMIIIEKEGDKLKYIHAPQAGDVVKIEDFTPGANYKYGDLLTKLGGQ